MPTFFALTFCTFFRDAFQSELTNTNKDKEDKYMYIHKDREKKRSTKTKHEKGNDCNTSYLSILVHHCII